MNGRQRSLMHAARIARRAGVVMLTLLASGTAAGGSPGGFSQPGIDADAETTMARLKAETARVKSLISSITVPTYAIRIYGYDAECNPAPLTSPNVGEFGCTGPVEIVPVQAFSILGFEDPTPPISPTPAPTLPPTPPAAPQDPGSAPKHAEPVPSLDDLLGTKGESPSPKPAPTGEEPTDLVDPTRGDLDRLLKGEEIGEAFTEAVGLMDDAAKRLEQAQDASLTTQRVQEDVIRRLDQLLASLKRQQNSSSSSSSSSSSQQQQQDKQSQRNQPSKKKPSKSTSGKSQQTQAGEGQRNDLGPARQDGPLKPNLDSARAAWGALPERVREMLLQGSSDHFSAKYQGLTEAYYRRLAEEKK